MASSKVRYLNMYIYTHAVNSYFIIDVVFPSNFNFKHVIHYRSRLCVNCENVISKHCCSLLLLQLT